MCLETIARRSGLPIGVPYDEPIDEGLAAYSCRIARPAGFSGASAEASKRTRPDPDCWTPESLRPPSWSRPALGCLAEETRQGLAANSAAGNRLILIERQAQIGEWCIRQGNTEEVSVDLQALALLGP
jgi:hypothetical protein